MSVQIVNQKTVSTNSPTTGLINFSHEYKLTMLDQRKEMVFHQCTFMVVECSFNE